MNIFWLYMYIIINVINRSAKHNNKNTKKNNKKPIHVDR